MKGKVDVIQRNCSREECCIKWLSCSVGRKLAVLGMQHAEEGKVDIKRRRCTHETCGEEHSLGVQDNIFLVVCTSGSTPTRAW